MDEGSKENPVPNTPGVPPLSKYSAPTFSRSKRLLNDAWSYFPSLESVKATSSYLYNLVYDGYNTLYDYYKQWNPDLTIEEQKYNQYLAENARKLREYTLGQETLRLNRQKIIDENYNKDISQLKREFGTCENWADNQRFTRGEIKKWYEGKLVDENGQIVPPPAITQGKSELDPKRIDKLCDSMLETQHNFDRTNRIQTTLEIDSSGVESDVSRDDLLKKFQDRNAKVSNALTDCQIKTDEVANELNECRHKTLILEDRLEEQALNCTVKPKENCTLFSRFTPDELAEMSPEKMTEHVESLLEYARTTGRAENAKLLNKLKQEGKILTKSKKLSLYFWKFLLWPLNLTDEDFFAWGVVNVQQSKLSRNIVAYVLFVLWILLISYFVAYSISYLISKKEESFEVEEPSKFKQRSKLLSKSSYLGLSQRGGAKTILFQELCYDYIIFHTISSYKIQDYLEGRISKNEIFKGSKSPLLEPLPKMLSPKLIRLVKKLKTKYISVWKKFKILAFTERNYVAVVSLSLIMAFAPLTESRSAFSYSDSTPANSKPAVELLVSPTPSKIQDVNLKETRSPKKVKTRTDIQQNALKSGSGKAKNAKSKPYIPLDKRTSNIARLRAEKPELFEQYQDPGEEIVEIVRVKIPERPRISIRNKNDRNSNP